jgi:hypothetical protein
MQLPFKYTHLALDAHCIHAILPVQELHHVACAVAHRAVIPACQQARQITGSTVSVSQQVISRSACSDHRTEHGLIKHMTASTTLDGVQAGPFDDEVPHGLDEA